ncbi:MAG: isovaleryl-CoA dehydrogenase [Planctomycetia bacterium 21-64-5]|nr:MAG: isovaleryl-CoA dehydrogenase [Planctomycetia bacterium 21-64-5]HQU41605.1 acyl-CoA dehydrogenase family protein [Pirellulales bacterium]
MPEMQFDAQISSPDGPGLDRLCQGLASRADALDASSDWPAEQLELCRQYGVNRWFVGPEWGGTGWSEVDLIRGFMRLSSACLATTFVLTQPLGVCRRLAVSDNHALRDELLPKLASGHVFATVGISHLTTSRRHLAKPVLAARETDNGFVLNGSIPWVTGAVLADYIVTGATCDDGRQILAVLPTNLPGFSASPPARLVGLTATLTGGAECRDVLVDRRWLLAGPTENVLSGKGAGTGGVQTSALALGLAAAALDYLEREAATRADLMAPASSLRAEHSELEAELLTLAAGGEGCSPDELRSRANSLVLRATQGALTAAKGSGYVLGHPAGRWCREALFFLVWSCPQPVMAAALCELAGLSD